jgi:hypothetical protein
MPSERLRFRDSWFVKVGLATIVLAVVPFIFLCIVSFLFDLKGGPGAIVLLFLLGTFAGLVLVALGVIGTIVQSGSKHPNHN